MAGMPYWLFVW